MFNGDKLLMSRLNPCFSGTYSRRASSSSPMVQRQVVLILVLVEHTLGAYAVSAIMKDSPSLNPCFSGTYSRSFDNIPI